MHDNRASFQINYAIAQADFSNPFVSTISFIFTDFLPNQNNQAVPVEEAENIISTARGMPLKINVETGQHEGAETIGPITRAWLGEDNGRQVIYAEAAIWKLEYPEIDNFIREKYKNQEPLAVSWELVYQRSETDSSNTQWLRDVVVTGVALVDQPAYGHYRTRVLAIAQSLEASMSDTQHLDPSTIGQTPIDQPPVPEAIEQATAELERELARARDEIAQLREQITHMKRELTFAERKDVLREFFPDVDSRRDFILSLSDAAFASYAADLRALAQRPAEAAVASTRAIPAGIAQEPISPVELFKRLI